MTHTYSDDYPHNRYVTTYPFTPADVKVGIWAMTGDHAAMMPIYSWPTEKWDSVRAFIREADMVRTEGQWTHLTRHGRRYLHALRDGSIQ